MPAVVFCEDDPTIQKLIRVALRSCPFEVHIAGDGAEGLDLIERLRPMVVFTDVSMPNVDGPELIRRMKARPELADIPVVVLTASAQRSELEAATRLGVDDCMTKPFSAADLRRRIEGYADRVG